MLRLHMSACDWASALLRELVTVLGEREERAREGVRERRRGGNGLEIELIQSFHENITYIFVEGKKSKDCR